MWGQNWGQMIWGKGAAVPALGFWGAVALGALLMFVGRRFLDREPRPRAIGFLALALASLLPISGALAALPFTFTNGQAADATQVNANFAAISNSFMANEFQDVSLSPGSGVAVASISLPVGSIYLLQAKFRYEGTGTSTQQVSCFFQGTGVGGLDVSSNNVPPAGSAQIDGFMMDTVDKRAANSMADVHIQCIGSPSVHVINPQFVAIPMPGITFTF
jgi:hypothetical protein